MGSFARIDVGSFGIPGDFAMPFYNAGTQKYDMPGLRKYLRGQLPADRYSFTDPQIDDLISGRGLPGSIEMYDLQAGQGGSSGVGGATASLLTGYEGYAQDTQQQVSTWQGSNPRMGGEQDHEYHNRMAWDLKGSLGLRPAPGMAMGQALSITHPWQEREILGPLIDEGEQQQVAEWQGLNPQQSGEQDFEYHNRMAWDLKGSIGLRAGPGMAMAQDLGTTHPWQEPEILGPITDEVPLPPPPAGSTGTGRREKVVVDLPGTGTEEDPIVFPDTTVTAPGDGLPEQPAVPIGRAYQGGTILELEQLPLEMAHEALSGPVNINGTFYQLGSDSLLYSGDFPAGVVGYGQSTDTGTLGLNLGDTPPLLDTPLPEGGHWSGLSEEVWLGLSDEIRAQIDFVVANESDPERAQLKIEALSHTGRFAWQAPEPSATAGIEAYLYDPSFRLPDGGFTPLDWDSVEQRRNPGGLKLPDGRVEGDNMSGQLNLPYDPPSHFGFDTGWFGEEGIRLRGTRQFIPGGKTYLPLVWSGGVTGLEHQEAGAELPITFTPEEQDALLGSQGWVLKQQPDSEVYSGELTGIDVSEYTEKELLELGHLESGREWTLYLMTKGGRVLKLPWFDGPPRKTLQSWEQKVFNAVRGSVGGVVDETFDLVDSEQLRDDVLEFIELLGIGTEGSGVELPDSTELNIEGAKYGPGGQRWEDYYEERDGRPGVQPGDFDIIEMQDGSYKIQWKSWSLDDTGDDDDQGSRRAKLVSNGFEGAESDDGFFLGKRVAI